MAAKQKQKKPSSKQRVQLEFGDVKKRVKPLVSVARPPAFVISSKGKEKENTSKVTNERSNDDRLWVDRYEPQTEGELAVHKRKVEDVRRWFLEAFEGGSSGKLKKYRRVLVLTGPAGTAKTTTIKILSREVGFDVLEWRNPLEEKYEEGDFERESLTKKFETFLSRASSCRPLLSTPITASGAKNSAGPSKPKRQVVLLEDLPNILHPATQSSFHAALSSFVSSATEIPIVIVISDTVTRGDALDERVSEGRYRGSRGDVMDIRSVLPPGLLGGPYVTQISFNPVAPTLMSKALQAMLKKHFEDTSPDGVNFNSQYRPTKEELDLIVSSSNGDMRSAIMSLQFLCIHGESLSTNTKKKGNKKTGKGDQRALLEAITRREQSLALFHLLGKILYNKRKGDPPTSSMSAKDKVLEKELDSRLLNPMKLPSWLSLHDRHTSRVDIDTLYADSPVDTSLFSLYIHQNYPQFCDDIEQCESLSDWLSWIDSSGGETWHQANPHQFHLLTLGALHSLPSPVTRRSQKIQKPQFFDSLQRQREAEEAVNNVSEWMKSFGIVSTQDDELPASEYAVTPKVGAWPPSEVALELGAVLKALSTSRTEMVDYPLPPYHASFSTLSFSSTLALQQDLDEDETAGDIVELEKANPSISYKRKTRDQRDVLEDGGMNGTWLETDDIEEYE